VLDAAPIAVKLVLPTETIIYVCPGTIADAASTLGVKLLIVTGVVELLLVLIVK
jgi:hypothetical protein